MLFNVGSMHLGGVLRLWVVAPTAGMHAFTSIAKRIKPGVNTTHNNLNTLYNRRCTHEQHTALLAAVFTATTRYLMLIIVACFVRCLCMLTIHLGMRMLDTQAGCYSRITT
jgi:hypothetical protein